MARETKTASWIHKLDSDCGYVIIELEKDKWYQILVTIEHDNKIYIQCASCDDDLQHRVYNPDDMIEFILMDQSIIDLDEDDKW
jgi:hypothetical protein